MVKKCLPPAIAPHPQVELRVVEAAAVACAGPRIGGPTGASPLHMDPIGDGGRRVAPREAWQIGTLPRSQGGQD